MTKRGKKQSQRVKQLKAGRLWTSRYRRKFSDVQLVEQGVAELDDWRKRGRIPMDQYLAMLERAAEDARERMI